MSEEESTRKRTRIKLRIFVASPGDVMEERNCLARAVEQLNRGVADRLGLTLELIRWETHIAPDVGRPQGVVFEQLPHKEWDIFVGILWLRFGSETGEIDPDTGKPYCSGTEEEFKAAYHRRVESGTGWPRVMFYRCIRSPADVLNFDTTQFARVEQFFAKFAADGAHPGLIQHYSQPDEFERLVHDHLEKWLWEFAQDRGLSKGDAHELVQSDSRHPLDAELELTDIKWTERDKEAVDYFWSRYEANDKVDAHDEEKVILWMRRWGFIRPTSDGPRFTLAGALLFGPKDMLPTFVVTTQATCSRVAGMNGLPDKAS
jgi:hypothetical protein